MLLINRGWLLKSWFPCGVISQNHAAAGFFSSCFWGPCSWLLPVLGSHAWADGARSIRLAELQKTLFLSVLLSQGWPYSFLARLLDVVGHCLLPNGWETVTGSPSPALLVLCLNYHSAPNSLPSSVGFFLLLLFIGCDFWDWLLLQCLRVGSEQISLCLCSQRVACAAPIAPPFFKKQQHCAG